MRIDFEDTWLFSFFEFSGAGNITHGPWHGCSHSTELTVPKLLGEHREKVFTVIVSALAGTNWRSIVQVLHLSRCCMQVFAVHDSHRTTSCSAGRSDWYFRRPCSAWYFRRSCFRAISHRVYVIFETHARSSGPVIDCVLELFLKPGWV